jgi:hypothetical protein
MNTRHWLGMVLIVLALGWGGDPALRAQSTIKDIIDRVSPPRPRRSGPAMQPQPPARESHKPLDTNWADSLSPEDLLALRLNKARDRQEKGNLKDLFRKLLKNPDLLESLSKQVSEEQIKRWQEQLQRGEGIEGAAGLKQFIEKAKNDKTLSPSNQEFLKRFAETMKKAGDSDSRVEGGGEVPRDKTAPKPGAAPGAVPGTTPKPDPSTLEGLKEKAAELFRKGADRWLDPKWVDDVMGSARWRDLLRDMTRRADEARGQTSRVSESAATGLARHLPRLAGVLPKSLTSAPAAPRLPSVPRIGAPRVGGVSGDSAKETGKLLLWLAVLGVLVLILWRAGGWWEKIRGVQVPGWQIGPWPIRPGDVSTRADLVRAFEYLSLLCLGPSARTCHHIDLAGRIGALPALDPDRRRESADTLARLYEQARYTPDDEVLPPEQMACARRELCYLAGVPA